MPDPELLFQRYGFKWGAASIERLMTLPKGQVILGLTTPKRSLQLYITRTGKVRIFEDNKELKIG